MRPFVTCFLVPFLGVLTQLPVGAGRQGSAAAAPSRFPAAGAANPRQQQQQHSQQPYQQQPQYHQQQRQQRDQPYGGNQRGGGRGGGRGGAAMRAPNAPAWAAAAAPEPPTVDANGNWSGPGSSGYLARAGKAGGAPGATPQDAFDFESNNAKFSQVIEDMKKLDDPAAGAAGAAPVDATETPLPAPPKYNKKSSFFDDISTARDERSKGPVSRQQLRDTDSQTFGADANAMRRPGQGGGGGGNGQGGGWRGGRGRGGGRPFSARGGRTDGF